MKKPNCLKLLITFLPLYLIPLFFPSSALAAKFYLQPADFETRKGKTFQVQVNLDTEDKKVSGIDLVLEYPKELIWVDKVDWGEIFEEEFININIKGKLSLSAAKEEDDEYFQGSGRLVTLTFSTHGQGTADLDFVCRADAQDETNIIEFETGNDLVDYGRLRKGIYVIHSKDWWPGQEEEEEEEKGCTEAPSFPTNLKAVSGPGSGEMTLIWAKSSGADFYTISYGLISGNYIYGAPNIGDTNQYAVRGLTPGKVYYFVMTSVNDCGSSGYSQEVWAKSGGAPVVVTPTSSPTVVDYVPSEEPEVTASPSATPELSPTEEPSPFADVEPRKKVELPFWAKYLAIAAGAGLFLIVVGQELISAIKRRPPKPPAQPPGPPPAETQPPPPTPTPTEPSPPTGEDKPPWLSS